MDAVSYRAVMVVGMCWPNFAAAVAVKGHAIVDYSLVIVPQGTSMAMDYSLVDFDPECPWAYASVFSCAYDLLDFDQRSQLDSGDRLNGVFVVTERV